MRELQAALCREGFPNMTRAKLVRPTVESHLSARLYRVNRMRHDDACIYACIGVRHNWIMGIHVSTKLVWFNGAEEWIVNRRMINQRLPLPEHNN